MEISPPSDPDPWEGIPTEIACEIIKRNTDVESIVNTMITSKIFLQLVRFCVLQLTSTREIKAPLVNFREFTELREVGDNISLIINQLEDVSSLSTMYRLNHAVFLIIPPLTSARDFIEYVNGIINSYLTPVAITNLDGSQDVFQRSLDAVFFRIIGEIRDVEVFINNRLVGTRFKIEVVIDHGSILLHSPDKVPYVIPIEQTENFGLIDTIDDFPIAISDPNDAKNILSLYRLKSVYFVVEREWGEFGIMEFVTAIIDAYLTPVTITMSDGSQSLIQRKLGDSLIRIMGRIGGSETGLIIDHGRIFFFRGNLVPVGYVNQITEYLAQKDENLTIYNLPTGSVSFLVKEVIGFINEGDFGLVNPSRPPNPVDNPPLKSRLQMSSSGILLGVSLLVLFNIYYYVNRIYKEKKGDRLMKKYLENIVAKHNIFYHETPINLDNFRGSIRMQEFTKIGIHSPRSDMIMDIRIPEVEANVDNMTLERESLRSAATVYRNLRDNNQPFYMVDGTLSQ